MENLYNLYNPYKIKQKYTKYLKTLLQKVARSRCITLRLHVRKGSDPIYMYWFFFIQMLDITVRAKIPISLDFWKALVGVDLDTVTDIKEVDPLTYSYLKKIEMVILKLSHI